MAILVPGILTKDPLEVKKNLKFLETIPEICDIQIDFEDGKFVSNTTVLPRDLAGVTTRLNLEAHLMVRAPQHFFHELELAGYQNLLLHYESLVREADLVTALENARHMRFQCGVALNPETDLEVLDRLTDKIDSVLLMSVQPGWQGQEFLPETLERIAAVRKKYPEMVIEVDGGVKLENFEDIVAQGADRIVVGSGIWQAPDPKARIYEFLEKINPVRKL